MVRKFQKGDTAQIMRIWLESNLETHSFVPGAYWISNYTVVQEQLGQADIYVFETEQEICGFAGMMDSYLAGIFVDKAHRSKGAGKALLDFIKTIYPEIKLDVYEKNERALDFYLREGFWIEAEGIDKDTCEREYRMLWRKNLEM